jgi:hypothetical protein
MNGIKFMCPGGFLTHLTSSLILAGELLGLSATRHGILYGGEWGAGWLGAASVFLDSLIVALHSRLRRSWRTTLRSFFSRSFIAADNLFRKIF